MDEFINEYVGNKNWLPTINVVLTDEKKSDQVIINKEKWANYKFTTIFSISTILMLYLGILSFINNKGVLSIPIYSVYLISMSFLSYFTYKNVGNKKNCNEIVSKVMGNTIYEFYFIGLGIMLLFVPIMCALNESSANNQYVFSILGYSVLSWFVGNTIYSIWVVKNTTEYEWDI